MQDLIAQALVHAPLAVDPAWWSAEVRASEDWARLKATWDDLAMDAHMADGGTYRLRRYASFTAVPRAIALNPHAPHFQLLADNRVHGGVERFFAPMLPAALDNPLFSGTLERSLEVFTACERAAGRGAAWHVEAHQFRICALPDAPAHPTPEGMHSDGRDYVLMLLLERRNIVGAETIICGRDHRVLYCDTLTEPGTALLLNDRQVLHAVSPVHPERPEAPAYRDMLILTFCNTERPDSLFGVSTHKAAA